MKIKKQSLGKENSISLIVYRVRESHNYIFSLFIGDKKFSTVHQAISTFEKLVG